jgi:hypothetical protein
MRFAMAKFRILAVLAGYVHARERGRKLPDHHWWRTSQPRAGGHPPRKPSMGATTCLPCGRPTVLAVSVHGYGKLRRMTDRNPAIVIFYLYLAVTFVTIRQFIQRARTRYRWDPRPTIKRLT